MSDSAIQTRLCPTCQGEMISHSGQEFCPACLLQQGMRSSTLGGHRAAWTPPAVDELAKSFPHLEILQLLGHGGMGAVYKVRQPELDRIAALKILPEQVAHEPGFAERFLREARLLASLSHPHIVTVFEFGQRNGIYFLLMEFIDGVTLRQALRSEPVHRLSPKEALVVVGQLCDALQFAHDEGVIHRDIKPENILIDKRGRVKIADFGLARMLGKTAGMLTLTGTNQLMGTPVYMAPEQIEGIGTVDHRVDIYSMGVVFYELLTGELPLGRFSPPSKRAELDVRLDEVVMRTLEKEPDRRYQQASEVRTAVDTIRSPSQSIAARSGVQQNTWRVATFTCGFAAGIASLIVLPFLMNWTAESNRRSDTAGFVTQTNRLPPHDVRVLAGSPERVAPGGGGDGAGPQPEAMGGMGLGMGSDMAEGGMGFGGGDGGMSMMGSADMEPGRGSMSGMGMGMGMGMPEAAESGMMGMEGGIGMGMDMGDGMLPGARQRAPLLSVNDTGVHLNASWLWLTPPQKNPAVDGVLTRIRQQYLALEARHSFVQFSESGEVVTDIRPFKAEVKLLTNELWSSIDDLVSVGQQRQFRKLLPLHRADSTTMNYAGYYNGPPHNSAGGETPPGMPGLLGWPQDSLPAMIRVEPEGRWFKWSMVDPNGAFFRNEGPKLPQEFLRFYPVNHPSLAITNARSAFEALADSADRSLFNGVDFPETDTAEQRCLMCFTDEGIADVVLSYWVSHLDAANNEAPIPQPSFSTDSPHSALSAEWTESLLSLEAGQLKSIFSEIRTPDELTRRDPLLRTAARRFTDGRFAKPVFVQLLKHWEMPGRERPFVIRQLWSDLRLTEPSDDAAEGATVEGWLAAGTPQQVHVRLRLVQNNWKIDRMAAAPLLDHKVIETKPVPTDSSVFAPETSGGAAGEETATQVPAGEPTT